MNSDVDVLPAVSRLVIAYAPGKVREWHETLLLLDARLAGIVRSASEPMLAQLRLAWWRERFAQSVTDWPQGEPLLARLANWGEGAGALGRLVNGWEALVGHELLDADLIERFAQSRGVAWAALAEIVGADAEATAAAAREWALADLAARLSRPEERELARKVAADEPWRKPRLPRVMRPLRILHALGRRALRRDSDLLYGPGALVVAMRVGLAGR